eukprot:c8967_g1_i4.p1 GENE.c8967_g1_i4~~c8967_g1_i4.p1  ORF type:complete len:391 (+),score=44.09 c8967_g1_i4:51-1175(+)
MAGFFRGTSTEQDSRFKDKNKLLRKQLKFDPILNKKIDMKLVKKEVIMMWVRERISELLGLEDDVLVGLVENLLSEDNPDGQDMQIQLTGFLERRAAPFMTELWGMLLSAMENGGMPLSILEKTKEILKLRKLEEQRIQEDLLRRKQATTIPVMTDVVPFHRAVAPPPVSHAPGLTPITPGEIAAKKRDRKSKWDTDEPIQHKSIKEEGDNQRSATESNRDRRDRDKDDHDTHRSRDRRDSGPKKRHRSRSSSRSPDRLPRRRRSRSKSRSRSHSRSRSRSRSKSPHHRKDKSHHRRRSRRSHSRSPSRSSSRSRSPKHSRRHNKSSRSSSGSSASPPRAPSPHSIRATEDERLRRERELREKAIKAMKRSPSP